MRVLLFIDSFVVGGAQRQFLNLAEGLQNNANAIHVCTYYPLNELLLQSTCAFSVECFKKKSRFDLSPALKLGASIRVFKPDVVVAFLSTPCVYAELSRLTGHAVPIIASERNGPVSGCRRLVQSVFFPLHLLASRVVFNNESYKDLLAKRFPPVRSKSTLIYNGVDKQYFQQERDTGKSDSLTGKQVNKNFRFCAVSARPTLEKGIFDLINAADYVRARLSTPFTIDWIGPYNHFPEEAEAAKQLITKLDLQEIWYWKGNSNGMEIAYKGYDAMLVPSHREGLSNVLCEAMATGLPSVVTDIADHQLIIGDSDSGIVCEPGNYKSFGNGMLQITALKRSELKRMGENARAFAVENFSMEKYIQNWEKVIGDAIR